MGKCICIYDLVVEKGYEYKMGDIYIYIDYTARVYISTCVALESDTGAIPMIPMNKEIFRMYFKDIVEYRNMKINQLL